MVGKEFGSTRDREDTRVINDRLNPLPSSPYPTAGAWRAEKR